MSEWKEYRLDQLGRIVTGKTPPASIQNSYSIVGTQFVTPRDMDGRKWMDSTERYLNKDGLDSVINSLVPKNSVAVSCIGSDMGKTVILKKESVTNQQINSIVVEQDFFNPDFVYYVLSTKQENLKAIAGGSATPILNKGHFGKFTIYLPKKAIQDKISSILSALDDKIAINQQINKTLRGWRRRCLKVGL
jgi:type I restriction enzyme S subunit